MSKTEIKANLYTLGRNYKSKGKTVSEVLKNFKIPVAKAHGVLSLKKGKLEKERVLNSPTMNMIFGKGSPTIKEISVKNIISLFSDFDK